MIHIRSTLFAASVAISGCKSTTVQGPVLQPVATAAGNDTLIKSTGSWVLAQTREAHTYHSVSRTTVHELANSTLRQNTIEISTVFTISLDQSHRPVIISGHIDTV